MEISIVDCTLALDTNGEPRVNLGDVNSGAGFASSVAMFASGDGFVGVPNGPDGGQGAPQALMLTQGIYRYALAVRDPRTAAKAANKIQLLALAQEMEVTLDASAGTISLKVPGATVTVGPSGIRGSYTSGPATAAFNFSDVGIDMAFVGPGGGAGMNISDLLGGTVNFTCTKLQHNGVDIP